MAKNRRARQAAKARARSRKANRARAIAPPPRVVVHSSDDSVTDLPHPSSTQIDSSSHGSVRGRSVSSKSAESDQSLETSGTNQSGLSGSTSSDDEIRTLLDTPGGNAEVGVAGTDDGSDNPFEGTPYSGKLPFDKTTISLYDPDTYRCSGYINDGYQRYDGRVTCPDQRFLIDLENGTMDQLPDVRPYLYYVGFWAGDWAGIDLNTSDPSINEDRLVRAGRRYLLGAQAKGAGYFLAHRELSTKYRSCTPFRAYLWNDESEELPGDVGVGDYHLPEGEDGVMDVVTTNIRIPLPDEEVCKHSPGDDRWDAFVCWLYSFQIHPVVGALIGHHDEDTWLEERHFYGAVMGNQEWMIDLGYRR